MSKRIFISLFIGLLAFTLMGSQEKKNITPQEKDTILMQKVNANPTPIEERFLSFDEHQKMAEESLFKNMKWRNVGPVVQGGRLTDIEVPKGKPFTIFIAVASGGVWKTDNNCTTWEPIFDKEATFTIGDIAIAESNPDIIWIGTGENNSSRSSYAGTGVYKSIDGGKTWKYMGLGETHHIGRIIIHPTNPDIVYVSAIGHLYTYDEKRGLYKSIDGGKTWKKLPIPTTEKVGVIDIVMDPQNPDILYASTWERERRAWNFVESGPGSGIYKSNDGGETWKRFKNGLPYGWFVGRIGLAVSPSNPNVVYALIDDQRIRPEAKEEVKKRIEKGAIPIEILEKMSKEEFLALGKEKIAKFLEENRFPKEYSAEKIIGMIKNGEITPKDLANYLSDANRRLISSRVIGPVIYKSEDRGETWKKVNKEYISGFYNTYGYYFGQIRVDPKNENKVYILGVPLMVSEDGGVTFKKIGGRGVHADHHALWIDPENPNRILDGNDGGLNISYDGGKTWQKINNIPIGQFYTVTVENKPSPYRICGGLQDNGVMCGTDKSIPGITEPWQTILGGDGGYVQLDPSDPNIAYAEFQFGNIYKIDLKNKNLKSIKPQSKLGEPPLRFNWQTPFLISPHNPYILYIGANRLFISYDRGDHWYPISPDLTTNPPLQGDVPFATITTISESPLKPGLIYVGTDDGKVWVTKNGGAMWEEINKGLPEKWVSRIVASAHDEKTVYLTLTGYRDDDFKTYVYKSTDYGKTWKSIKGNLPDEPVNVIREDTHNKNVLYLGTDLGVYISINGGQDWHSLRGNLPTLPVHDIAIQAIESDIVIGTHGRSVYIMDTEPIQELNEEILKKDGHLFKIKPVIFSLGYRFYITGERPKAKIYFYLKEAKAKSKVTILDSKEEVIKEIEGSGDRGINLVEWDLTTQSKVPSERYAKPGKYLVKITAGKVVLEGELIVKPGKSLFIE
jgi:photosystem II stability/assembly factor-like uncharacterized protein